MESCNEFLSKSEKETSQIVSIFIDKFLDFSEKNATIVGLYGDLGSGKTTFMKYLAKEFGVGETIQSPTFVIMKKYSLKDVSKNAQVQDEKLWNFLFSNFQTLIHIDAYRIEKDEEMLNLGWQEIISDPQNLIFIEWPEKIISIMPKHIKIYFEHKNENERKIIIKK